MYSLSDCWLSHTTGNSIPGSLTSNSPLMSFLELEDRGAKVIDRLSTDLMHEFPEMKGFPVNYLKPLFFDPPKKKDLDNDPF